MAPAERLDFRRELTACLTLVAPTGMSEDDRNEWFKVAWGTLQGIPADLLARAASVARKTCDHPAKVVPAIMREAEAEWMRRRGLRSEVLAALAKMQDAPVPEEERCTPEEAAEIIRRVGLKLSDDKPAPRTMPDWMRDNLARAESE